LLFSLKRPILVSGMEHPVSLSIVIPAFNEALRIVPTLEAVVGFLGNTPWAAELIIVDDGSTDGTERLAQGFIERTRDGEVPVRLLLNGSNRGKGYSVRNGFLHSNGEIVAFTDADLSAPIEELPKLLDDIVIGEQDIVIGSRAVDRSLIGKHQSPWRELAGRTFNLMMKAIVGLDYRDTQCGFKAYRREAARPIFESQTIDGFSFDVEILFLAKKKKLRIKEVPVVWSHAEGSRVHMLKDSAKMFLDLLRIRWNDFRGLY
jgi:glycosyltransferase involved in cell wall biosynthesis